MGVLGCPPVEVVGGGGVLALKPGVEHPPVIMLVVTVQGRGRGNLGLRVYWSVVPIEGCARGAGRSGVE